MQQNIIFHNSELRHGPPQGPAPQQSHGPPSRRSRFDQAPSGEKERELIISTLFLLIQRVFSRTILYTQHFRT